MAEKNLTSALLELKDKGREKTLAKPPRSRSSNAATLPYRPRSFDAFYSFIFALLIAALIAQLVAIIIYS